MPDQKPLDEWLEQLLLIQRYFDQDLSDRELQDFNRSLQASEAFRQLFVDYSRHCSAMQEVLGLQSICSLDLSQEVSSNEDSGAFEAQTLAVLHEAEEKAEPDFALLNKPAFETPSAQADQHPVTARELWSLAGYLASKGLRTKAGVIGSIAAVLVLGVVLLLVILPQGDTPITPETAVSTPNEPDQVSPANPTTNAIVATLTAEHEAVWDRQPGQELYAGQRFTLSDGFAEITTERGAIALLEAPCTIEMIHDNAIRLERGRLVGTVETERAKGFLVRTPLMDVVDLGTRFGVETDPAGTSSAVYVFDGLVQASLLYTDGGPSDVVRLKADQSLVARAGQGLARADIDPARFISDPAVLPYLIETGETARFLGMDRPSSLMPEALESSQWMHVVLEKTGVNVAESLTAGITEPGTYRSFVGPGDPVAYEGRVDSYLAHLDPVGKEKPVTLSGEITFPRPIVAVLVNGEQLIETDSMFANPGTQLYRDPAMPFGLDGGHADVQPGQTDELVLSKDRRTLRYRLFALEPFDEFRVLIEAAEQEP